MFPERFLSTALLTICITCVQAQQPVLPGWMARAVGRSAEPNERSATTTTGNATKNRFVGTYEASFQLLMPDGIRSYTLSAWSDSSRTVVQFTGADSRIAYLADIDADVALLARADSVGGHAAIHRLSDMTRMNQLYWIKASWDSCRALPHTLPYELLGAMRSACYHTEGTDTTRYWQSNIEPSPFMDARLHVPVPTLEPFEVFRYVCKVDGPMPLRVEGPALVFEVTDVQAGARPMPTVDLHEHTLFDLREGNSAVKRVDLNGTSTAVTTRKPAEQHLAYGAPWFDVSAKDPVRTLLIEPDYPADVRPGCLLCVDLMIDDLGMVTGTTVDRTNVSAFCAPEYDRAEKIARSLRFTPRRLTLKPGQKASACFRYDSP